MATNIYFAHNPSLKTDIPNACPGIQVFGENVGLYDSPLTVANLMYSFAHSLGHCLNMDDPTYSIVGIGTYTNPHVLIKVLSDGSPVYGTRVYTAVEFGTYTQNTADYPPFATDHCTSPNTPIRP